MSACCVISGVSGYLGGVLARYFLEQGWSVRGLSRRTPSLHDPHFEHIPFELSHTPPADIFSNASLFIHAAYDFQPFRWKEIERINIEGSQKLFELAEQSGVEQLIYVSSISAFEECRSLYGKAKLAIEKAALQHQALVVRPGLIYGPAGGAMFGRLCALIDKLPVIPLMGGGEQDMYLVHETDLAKSILELTKDPSSFPSVMTAAFPQPVKFQTILRTIAERKKKKPLFVPIPVGPVLAGLRMVESLGFPLSFRSDSLLSLLTPNPHLDFTPLRKFGLNLRRFNLEAFA